jgi:hydrogenase-1 operon protein HyaE
MTIPIPPAPGRDARSFPLIAQLFAKHGYAEVDGAGFDAFAAHAGDVLLVFTEDPARVKETLDLAVIVPQIARAFPGRFEIGVLLPEAARAIQPRYGFRRWPALVLLRDGRYVGAVDGLRDWDDYIAEVGRLLVAPPSRPPSVGIAVRSSDESNNAGGA